MTLLAATLGAADHPQGVASSDEPERSASGSSEAKPYPLADGAGVSDFKKTASSLLPNEALLGGSGGAAVPGYRRSGSGGGVLVLSSVFEDFAMDVHVRGMSSGPHDLDARRITEVDTSVALGLRWRLLQAGRFGLWFGPRLGGLFITKRYAQGKGMTSETDKGIFGEAAIRLDVRLPESFFLYAEASARVIAPMTGDKREALGQWGWQPLGALGVGYAW